MNPLAARVEEARQRWNAGDLDGYLTLYDESIRLHGYSPEPLDKPGVTTFCRQVYAALTPEGRPSPDLQFYEIVTQNNFYCCRFTMTGVHRGTFLGVPGTGRPYSIGGITILRFEDLRVVERWLNADMLGLMIQIGAVEPPS